MKEFNPFFFSKTKKMTKKKKTFFFFVKKTDLGLWPGNSTLKENRSNMSKDASKAIQSGDSEVDQIRKRNPGAPFCILTQKLMMMKKKKR